METAWVIEKASSFGYGPPEYLCIRGRLGRMDSPIERVVLEWTEDHFLALRFSRKVDAILFVYMMIQLSKSLPESERLDGLRIDDDVPYVREHVWSN
jgi:hypothetical protein